MRIFFSIRTSSAATGCDCGMLPSDVATLRPISLSSRCRGLTVSARAGDEGGARGGSALTGGEEGGGDVFSVLS